MSPSAMVANILCCFEENSLQNISVMLHSKNFTEGDNNKKEASSYCSCTLHFKQYVKFKDTRLDINTPGMNISQER